MYLVKTQQKQRVFFEAINFIKFKSLLLIAKSSIEDAHVQNKS